MPRRPPLHLLVGFVPSPSGHAAVELAATIAVAADRARVTVASILSTDPLSVPTINTEFTGPLVEEIESHLRPAAGRLPADVSVETRVLAAGSPSAGLDEIARAVGADVLVLGETHRSRHRDLPRDTASRLLAGAPCPLAIAPADYVPRRPMRTVGVAFDGSPESERALVFAHRLVPADAELLLIAVVDRPRLLDFGRRADMSPDELERMARNQLTGALRAAESDLPAGQRRSARVLDGDPASELADVAGREPLDALVVGSRGYGPAGGVALGSVSQQLLTAPACPTVVVPRG